MWFVYLIRGTRGALYTGVSTNVERRVKEHNTSKRGARWAKANRPVTLVWVSDPMPRSEALKKEATIKKWPKAYKELLTKSLRNCHAVRLGS